MALGSVTAKNAVLTATIGDGRASSIQDTYYLAYFSGDPLTTGTELTASGSYSRTAVAWTDAVWAAAASGAKSNAVAIQSAVSTGPYSAPITHIAFFDSAGIGTGNMWDCGPLDTSITVAGGNSVVRFNIGGITISVA